MEEDQDSPAWQMTDKRREKMSVALSDVQYLLHRQIPPSFDEMECAIEKLTFEHGAAKNNDTDPDWRYK